MLEAATRNILHIAHNRKYWCLFFLFLAINFVMRGSLVEPGLILANDFTRAEDFNSFVSSHLYPTWDEHAQRSNLLGLTQVDLYTPAIIVSSVIDTPNTIIYLVYFVVLGSVSGVFSFKLAEYVMVRMNLKPRFEFAIVSSLFFMFATFVVGTAFHPGITFSFYLSPLVFYLLIKGVEEDRISYLLLSSVIYALLAHGLHFVVFGLIIILSYIVYDLLYRILVQRFRSFSSLKRAAWYTLIIIGPFIALNSYWLIPNLYFSGLSLNPNLIAEESSNRLYRNSDIINIFSVRASILKSFYPYSESELTYMNILSITLTVIAVSSLVLYKPNKLLIYLATFLALSAITSVVPHYLPDLYNWLIFEMPGSSFYSWVFRVPRFSYFMIIPISVMLSLSSFRIYQIFLNRQRTRRFSKAVGSVFLAVVLVFSLVPNYILLTGDFNGLHRSHELPRDYMDMLAFLEKQEDSDVENYKSIWGPRYAGSNSSWSNNPIGRLEEQISPINTFNGKQTLNNYIYPVIFGIRYPFDSIVYDGQTNNLNEFLSPLNIKYIVVHDDIRSLRNKIDKMSTALSNQKGLESTQFGSGSTHIYTIKEPAEQFSIKQNTILIQGGGLLRFDSVFRAEDIIVNSSGNNNGKNNTEATALSNSIGVFFSDMSLEQNPEMWNLSDTLIPEKKLSYAEYMLDKNDVIVIPPSAYTNNFAPLELWSETLMNRPSAGLSSLSLELHRRGIELPYQFDYGKNIVFTSANNSKLAIPISLSEAGGREYKVLLRYFANEKGGLLDFNLGGKSLELETKSHVNRFIWADLGTVGSSSEQGTQTLSIENRNGFNALNLIALVPNEKYEQYKAEFINSLHDKDIIHILEAESDFNFLDRAGLSRVVSDIDYSNGKGLELRSAGHIASAEFEILKDGKYDLAVHGNGTITAYIDGVTNRTINLVEGEPHIESIELNSGNHFIGITQA